MRRLACAASLCWVLTWPMAGAGSESGDPAQRWREAIKHNRVDWLEALAPSVADIDLATAAGKTALMAAASYGTPSLVKTLVDAGAGVNNRNQGGGTALTYGAWSGNQFTLKLLVGAGADVNSQSSNGWTALMMTAAKGHAEAAQTLLQFGARADLSDVYGWTPLMRAAYEGNDGVVATLLEAAEPYLELRNDQGQTALHLAIIGRRSNIAAQLLERGAWPNPVDHRGRTPRAIAEEMQQTTAVTMLRTAEDQH